MMATDTAEAMKAPALLLITLLAACSTTEDDGYPSLAPREIEKIDINEPAADNALPSPGADSTLSRKLAEIEGRARSGNARFEPLYGTAQRATNAARGSAPGSEAWVVAQQAISRAEVATADTAAAVADIDKLVADLTDKASKVAGTAGVDEAIATQSRVRAIHDSQANRLRTLNRQLGGG